MVVRNPREVVLADIDNDRDMDLLIASQDDNSLTIVYSNCCQAGQRCASQCTDGSLAFTSAAIIPLVSKASGVAVGDLDGDGVKEIVVVGGQNVYVLVQPATVGNPWTILTVASTNANAVFTSVALTDLREKGRYDIVATDSFTSVV